MCNWLTLVSDFLGCTVAELNPNTIYVITCVLLGIFVWSFAYVLGRCGRR